MRSLPMRWSGVAVALPCFRSGQRPAASGSYGYQRVLRHTAILDSSAERSLRGFLLKRAGLIPPPTSSSLSTSTRSACRRASTASSVCSSTPGVTCLIYTLAAGISQGLPSIPAGVLNAAMSCMGLRQKRADALLCAGDLFGAHRVRACARQSRAVRPLLRSGNGRWFPASMAG